MKIINREIGYAIKSLCFIFKEKRKIVTAGQLADSFKISLPFLRKILQKLNYAGILESSKGKNGGFRMSMPANNISLVDLIEIYQGSLRLCNCYSKGQDCPLIEECPIQNEIEKIENKLISDLSKISLDKLIKKDKYLSSKLKE